MIPSPGRRCATAISSARATSGASATGPIAQPTIRREKQSSTLARCSTPSPVGICFRSEHHNWFGPVGLEVALDQIRPDLHPVDAECAVGVAAALGRHVRALDALHAHQPLDPLVVDLTALTAQLGVHATGPVGPVALRVHTADLLDQRRVGERPLGRRAPRPGVVARARHAQHPAHHRDVEVALLRVDEPEHRYRISLPSLAKKAAALFRISRSCSRTRTRRRSCVSSSFSSEVRPSRRP